MYIQTLRLLDQIDSRADSVKKFAIWQEIYEAYAGKSYIVRMWLLQHLKKISKWLGFIQVKNLTESYIMSKYVLNRRYWC